MMTANPLYRVYYTIRHCTGEYFRNVNASNMDEAEAIFLGDLTEQDREVTIITHIYEVHQWL